MPHERRKRVAYCSSCARHPCMQRPARTLLAAIAQMEVSGEGKVEFGLSMVVKFVLQEVTCTLTGVPA
eukprot:1618186-Prymnesium_polylepis.1